MKATEMEMNELTEKKTELPPFKGLKSIEGWWLYLKSPDNNFASEHPYGRIIYVGNSDQILISDDFRAWPMSLESLSIAFHLRQDRIDPSDFEDVYDDEDEMLCAE